MKRINLAGSAHRREALFGLSTLSLLAMVLAGMAFWPTPADAGEPAEPVWSADMTVVQYNSVSIGAASADLFFNIGGSGNLQIKSLWSYIPGRDLRLAFDEDVPNAADYTLQAGDLSLEFPEGSSLQSGFTWSDVDVAWEDGQIVHVRIVPTAESDAPQANAPPSGLPTISGRAQVGHTLAADTSGIGDANGLTSVSYIYQWLADDAGIDGATSSTYTLQASDNGKAIKVRVNFTDDAGHAESLTSAGTSAVASKANIPTSGLPAISGTARVGYTLTADTSAIADADGLSRFPYAYQWIRSDGGADAVIADATDFTYALTGDDEGKTIKVKVTLVDDKGNRETLTSAATAEVGERQEKPQFLVSNLGVGAGGSGGIQRTLNTSRSGFAQAFTTGTKTGGYPLGSVGIQVSHFSDGWSVGDHLRVTVNGVASEGGPGDAHCTLTNPSSFPAPGVSAFEAPTGAGSCPQLATETTYFVVIEWLNPSETGSFALIPQTYPTAVSAATGEDQGGAEGWSIADQAYYLTVSSNVRAWTTYDETASFKIVVKKPADTAAQANIPATGLPTISGTAQVGETLTADTSGISDADGLDNVEYSYQWLADDADIQGATDSSHDLTGDEVGKAIRVKITFTDDADNEESLTSAATIAVAAASGPLTGFTLLDASNQAVLATPEDGDQVSLDDPSGGNYAIRADVDSSAAIGSVKLELTGAKTSTQTESVSPYSLYGDDGASALHGGNLPVGSYTLRATAYSEGAGAGDELGVLGVFFTVAAFNSPATGAPTISGTVQVDQTLTAGTSGIADADGLTNVEYSYQWLADDTDIEGAANSTYTLTDDEVGKAIKVKVTFTDDAGNDETLTSGATPTVMAAANNPATGLPTITGTAQAGKTLTADISGIADEDGLTNVSYSHQWLADDTDILGATGSTYNLTDDEVGKTVKVRVTFTDDKDNEESLTSTATTTVAAAANNPATGLPTISGTAQAGETLTADTSGIADADGLTNVEYSHRWLADDTDIPGATESTYTLTGDEVGKAIKVKVSFTDDANNQEALTSGATVSVAARSNSPATGAPTISGTVQADQTLTADTSGIADADGLTSVDYSYQWLADDTDIPGATESTYTLTGDEVGKAIKVKVSFTDDANNQETLTSGATPTVMAAANNPATGLPTITGTAQEGETLTADTSGIADEDGLTNVSYSHQWLADDADIQGAANSTYVLTGAEVGKTIKVKVTFTDDADNDETLTSTATAAVAAAPVPLTVSLENKPTSHDGTNDFSFDIRFSEEPHAGFSYKTLKLHAFNVSGGSVQKAQRLQKEPESNIGWKITVRPDGNGDVTVVLPVTTDCSATGAVCTGDGRMLSNHLEFTMSGPGG